MSTEAAWETSTQWWQSSSGKGVTQLVLSPSVCCLLWLGGNQSESVKLNTAITVNENSGIEKKRCVFQWQLWLHILSYCFITRAVTRWLKEQTFASDHSRGWEVQAWGARRLSSSRLVDSWLLLVSSLDRKRGQLVTVYQGTDVQPWTSLYDSSKLN